MMNEHCKCECGKSEITVSNTSIFRFICHCKICQSVYQKPYADVTVMLASKVELPKNHNIQFQKHRLPPAIQRGKCQSCGTPVIGFLRLMPFFKLAFVPSDNFSNKATLPDPSIHIFYDRRTEDIQDKLPKYSGYWKSQVAISQCLVASFIQGTSKI
ncbi:MAG: hypothetical protein ACI86H_001822 [bacterium]|jgi:hypothetical protein